MGRPGPAGFLGQTSVLFVDGRRAAPPGVAVHDVVVDEQSRLDEFDRRAGPDRGRGDPAGGHLAAQRDQSAADHFAFPREALQAAEDVPAPRLQRGEVLPLGGQEEAEIIPEPAARPSEIGREGHGGPSFRSGEPPRASSLRTTSTISSPGVEAPEAMNTVAASGMAISSTLSGRSMRWVRGLMARAIVKRCRVFALCREPMTMTQSALRVCASTSRWRDLRRQADRIVEDDVGDEGPDPFDDALGLLFDERGLGHDAGPDDAGEKLGGHLVRCLHDDGPGDLADDAADLLVTDLADDHGRPALGLDLADAVVDDLDHGAGGVDVLEAAALELAVALPGRAVALEDDDPAGRDLVEGLDDAQAFGPEGLDDMFVVDDLAEHVVGPVGPVGEEAVGRLEGLADAETVAQGFR